MAAPTQAWTSHSINAVETQTHDTASLADPEGLVEEIQGLSVRQHNPLHEANVPQSPDDGEPSRVLGVRDATFAVDPRRKVSGAEGVHIRIAFGEPQTPSEGAMPLMSSHGLGAQSALHMSSAGQDGLLQRFREYWQDQLESLGPQPKIEIEFVNCSVKVKTMAMARDGHLPNIVSPLRNLGRLCGQKTHYYRTVFENLNITFRPGQMSLLLGSPGSGKTTLLELIAGRLQVVKPPPPEHWTVVAGGGVILSPEPPLSHQLRPPSGAYWPLEAPGGGSVHGPPWSAPSCLYVLRRPPATGRRRRSSSTAPRRATASSSRRTSCAWSTSTTCTSRR